MNPDTCTAEILSYLRTELLDGAAGDVDETTPLLEWGLLTSLNTTRLVAHIRDACGVNLPFDLITGDNFKDVRSIVRTIAEVSTPAAGPAPQAGVQR